MQNMRVALVVVLAVGVLLSVFEAPASASTATAMVSEMNHGRRAHGLGPLAMSEPINRSSYGWARHLILSDGLARASLRRARVRGEIIEMHSGEQSKIRGALNNWMRSPAHPAVLLTGRFHRVG